MGTLYTPEHWSLNGGERQRYDSHALCKIETQFMEARACRTCSRPKYNSISSYSTAHLSTQLTSPSLLLSLFIPSESRAVGIWVLVIHIDLHTLCPRQMKVRGTRRLTPQITLPKQNQLLTFILHHPEIIQQRQLGINNRRANNALMLHIPRLRNIGPRIRKHYTRVPPVGTGVTRGIGEQRVHARFRDDLFAPPVYWVAGSFGGDAVGVVRLDGGIGEEAAVVGSYGFGDGDWRESGPERCEICD